MLNKCLIKKPREIVKELDKHIVGQFSAKCAVAIALRNRHRRRFVSGYCKNEVIPKNILMIGSTGVGKTEIARRLASLDSSPFVKVETTKFTEIGYVGRDVESIIRDLVDISIKLVKDEMSLKFDVQARNIAENRVLDILLDSLSKENYFVDFSDINYRQSFKKKLVSGLFDNKEIEIEIESSKHNVDFMSFGMENITNNFNSLLESILPQKRQKKRVSVKDALNILKEEALDNILDKDDIKLAGVKRVEEYGIVFLDEIDKIIQLSDHKNSLDVSRGGVQRDLLPLLDGCVVNTKYGFVKTNHILFIAAGAFHIAKPTDLIPELQGRLPIRVKFHALTEMDFVKILLEPDYSLIKQYKDLLFVEGVYLTFSNGSIYAIASVAYSLNQNVENIGARRLYTVMEKLLQPVLFGAGDFIFGDFFINSFYVYENLKDLKPIVDISRFIL